MDTQRKRNGKKSAVRNLNQRKRKLNEIAHSSKTSTPGVVTKVKGLENTPPPRPLEGVHDSRSISTLNGGITFHREQQHSNPEKEVEVLKCILLRQGYLERLALLAKRERRPTEIFVDLIDLIRNVTLEAIEHIVLWRRGLPGSHSTGAQFIWNGLNYLLRIPSDLDFLNKYPEVVSWCQVYRNPLMVPKPLDESVSANGSLKPSGSHAQQKRGKTKRMNPYETAVVNDPSLAKKKRSGTSKRKSRKVPTSSPEVPPVCTDEIDMVRVHKAHVVLLQEEELYGQYMRDASGLLVPTNKGNDNNNVHGTRTKELETKPIEDAYKAKDKRGKAHLVASPSPSEDPKVANKKRIKHLPQYPKGRAAGLRSGGDLLGMQKMQAGGQKQLPTSRSRGAKMEMTIKRKRKQVETLKSDLEMTERHAKSLEEDLENNTKMRDAERSRLRRELDFIRYELTQKHAELTSKQTALAKLENVREMRLEKQQLEQQRMRAITLMKKQEEKTDFQAHVDIPLTDINAPLPGSGSRKTNLDESGATNPSGKKPEVHTKLSESVTNRTMDWEPYCATEIQKVVRGFQGRRRFQRFFVLYHTSAILMQSVVRMGLAAAHARRKRQALEAAVLIQSFLRGERDRELVRQLRHREACHRSAILMQCVVRQMRGRIRMRRRKSLCKAVAECRQFVHAVSFKDVLQLAKLKSDEAPPNLLALVECLLVLSARGTRPLARPLKLSWKSAKRALRDPRLLRKLRLLADAAHDGVLLLHDDRVDSIAHYFCDPTFSLRAIASAGNDSVTERERQRESRSDGPESGAGANGPGVTASALFAYMQQLLECQKLGRFFMADRPGESAGWQAVLACDNPDGKELWEPRANDYDSDAIDPRRYVGENILYAHREARSRPIVVALASTVPTRVKDQLVLFMKRMLPGAFVHISNSQRDEWSCRMFGKEKMSGFARYVEQQEEEAKEAVAGEDSSGGGEPNSQAPQAGGVAQAIKADVLQQVIDSGKSILLDVNLGIGNKSKCAFLRIMATIQRSLVPSPLFLLVRGDDWNRGEFQPQTTSATRFVLEDILASRACIPYREAGELGVDKYNLDLVGGRYGPKGCRERIASFLFELPSREAHRQMCRLAQLDVPPKGLLLLMEAIVVILNPQDEFTGPSDQHVQGVSWETGAALLSLDPGVLHAHLRAVNLDAIPAKNLCALQAYVAHPAWPRLKAAEKVTTLLAFATGTGEDGSQKASGTAADREAPAGSVAAPVSSVSAEAADIHGLGMTQLLERVPVLQLLVGCVDNAVSYGVALVREGGAGQPINRRTSVFASVIVVRDGLDRLPAGYALLGGRHLTRRSGDLARESDGARAAMDELLSAVTKDVRIYSEARRVPSKRVQRRPGAETARPEKGQTTMILAVARDQGRIFIDGYDPYLCQRFTTFVLDEDVNALLAPNSSEMKNQAPAPPRTAKELCQRLLALVTLLRPKQPEVVSPVTGPPLPTELRLRRSRVLLAQAALRLESFKAIVRLQECQLGEVLVEAYVPADQSQHRMLIDYATLEQIATNTESQRERSDLESEDAGRMVPHLMDRLGFRRTDGGTGRLKMVLRCSSGPGRKVFEGSVRMDVSKQVYIISLFLVGVDESLRIEVYDYKRSQRYAFELSKRARLELLGTLNQGKKNDWIQNCFQRLRNRSASLVFDRTLLKLSLRIPFFIHEDLNATNGVLMVVEMISIDEENSEVVKCELEELAGGKETVRFQVFDTSKRQHHILQLSDQVMNKILAPEAHWPMGAHETQVELCSHLNFVAKQIRVGSDSGAGGVTPSEVVLVDTDNATVLLRSTLVINNKSKAKGELSKRKAQLKNGTGDTERVQGDDSQKQAPEETEPRLPDFVSPHIDGHDAEVLHRIPVFADEQALANKEKPNGELIYRKAHVLQDREIDRKQVTSVDPDDLLDEGTPQPLRVRLVLSVYRQYLSSNRIHKHEKKATETQRDEDYTEKKSAEDDEGSNDEKRVEDDESSSEKKRTEDDESSSEKKSAEDDESGSEKKRTESDDENGVETNLQEQQQSDLSKKLEGSSRQNEKQRVYILDCYDPVTQRHQRLNLMTLNVLISALGPRQELLDPEREEEMIEYLVEERLYLVRTKVTVKNGLGFQIAVLTSRVFGPDKVTPVTHCDIKDERSNDRNEKVVIAPSGKQNARGTKVKSTGKKLKVVGDIQTGSSSTEYWILTVFHVDDQELHPEQGGGTGPVFRILGYNPKTQAKSALVIPAPELVEAVEGNRAILAPACRDQLLDRMLPILRLHKQARRADEIVFPWKQLVQERVEQEQQDMEELARQQNQLEITQQLIDMYNINDAQVQKYTTVFSQAMILTTPQEKGSAEPANVDTDEEEPNSASHFVITANVVWLDPFGKTQLWIKVYDPVLGLSRSCCASRSFADEIASYVSGKRPSSLVDDQQWRGQSIQALAEWVEPNGQKARAAIAQKFSRVCQQCIAVERQDVFGDTNLRTLRVLLDESNRGSLGVGGYLDRLQEAGELRRQKETEELEESQVDSVTLSSLRKGECLLRTAHLLSGHFVVLSAYQLLQSKDDCVGLLLHTYCPALSQHAAREVLVKELQVEVNEETAFGLISRLSLRHHDIDNHMQLLLDGRAAVDGS